MNNEDTIKILERRIKEFEELILLHPNMEKVYKRQISSCKDWINKYKNK